MGICLSAKIKTERKFQTGVSSNGISTDGNNVSRSSSKDAARLVPPSPRGEGEILQSPNLEILSSNAISTDGNNMSSSSCNGSLRSVQPTLRSEGEILQSPNLKIFSSYGRSTARNNLSQSSSKGSSESVPPTGPEGKILQYPNLKIFNFADLKMATRNFSPDSVVGKGGFGSVFKGWIDENTCTACKPGTGTVIAVKRLNRYGNQGHREWLAEVNYLGQLSHPHLVKLIGYCLEEEHRLLVYEFMPLGSLDYHLFMTDSLPWSLRLKVALEAAKGLAFLHSAEAKVIHRDFKSSNILLDSNYNAKLADFGFAKDGPTEDKSHVSTRVIGTPVYGAPEYLATVKIKLGYRFIPISLLLTNILYKVYTTSMKHTPCIRGSTSYHASPQLTSPNLVAIAKASDAESETWITPKSYPSYLTTKNDVYSFGVVLLEMLSGKNACYMSNEGQRLVEWAKPFLANKSKIFHVLDDRLEGKYSLGQARKVAILSLRCLSTDPKLRPTMDEIVKELDLLKEFEQ